MDHYQQGRAFLSQREPEKARACFIEGLEADPKCAYGLVALAATLGEDMAALLSRLAQVLPQITHMADSADPEACFIAARCYETGSGVPQDIHTAMKYYTRAAMKGHGDAAFNLGCIYMQMGPGGEQLALEFFGKAADAQCADAQFALGYYYESHGDLSAAKNWYEKAAQSGDPGMVAKYHDFLNQ